MSVLSANRGSNSVLTLTMRGWLVIYSQFQGCYQYFPRACRGSNPVSQAAATPEGAFVMVLQQRDSHHVLAAARAAVGINRHGAH